MELDEATVTDLIEELHRRPNVVFGMWWYECVPERQSGVAWSNNLQPVGAMELFGAAAGYIADSLN